MVARFFLRFAVGFLGFLLGALSGSFLLLGTLLLAFGNEVQWNQGLLIFGAGILLMVLGETAKLAAIYYLYGKGKSKPSYLWSFISTMFSAVLGFGFSAVFYIIYTEYLQDRAYIIVAISSAITTTVSLLFGIAKLLVIRAVKHRAVKIETEAIV
ncbi:Uncharacterised protein [Candidatus Gugararchaeum adminiculabundum]|nr:Uncharacterised protein [Candidatus Gugararchaeum adminiculabundum]